MVAEKKEEARKLTRAMLGGRRGPQQMYVRVNALDSGMTLEDLAAVMPAIPDGIVLPKSRGGDDVRRLALWLDAFEAAAGAKPGTTRIAVVATETAEAMFGLGTYKDSSPRLAGLMWGAEDLVATLGGSSSRKADGSYRDVAHHVRSIALLTASTFGRVALDAVHLDIRDLDGLREEAEDAVALGFGGTVCIHPSQIPVVREAYRPTDERLDWARRVLIAARSERGVFAFEGQMVDSPVLKHAQMTLHRAGETVPQ